MTEVPWASADRIGAMTLPQLICLGKEEPPGRERLRTAEAFESRAAEVLRGQERWGSDDVG